MLCLSEAMAEVSRPCVAGADIDRAQWVLSQGKKRNNMRYFALSRSIFSRFALEKTRILLRFFPCNYRPEIAGQSRCVYAAYLLHVWSQKCWLGVCCRTEQQFSRGGEGKIGPNRAFWTCSLGVAK
jgi:hypothetical protein